jgi:cyclase
MRRASILIAIVLGGFTAAGLSAQGQPAMADIEQVSPNVWRVFGQGGTTTAFVRADGVALVDTKLANNGAAILAQLRKVTAKPVTLILNTHSHGDHVGSNAEINPRGEIEVVAHGNTARRMAAMPNVGTASRTFNDRLTLGSGAERIELYWFGAGHTDGDAFVVFPAERVMAAGDIFQLMAMPRIDTGAGGSALALPTSLARARDAITGVDKVIPGHDPQVRTWAEFRTYAAFAQAVAEAARAAHAAGQTPEQAVIALERQAGFAPLLAGGEGNTPRARALAAVTAAFAELDR